MSRYYKKLECGCLVSCDRGGALTTACHGYNEEAPSTCKVSEYLKKHDMIYGYCPVCHPIEYKEAIELCGDYRKEEIVK